MIIFSKKNYKGFLRLNFLNINFHLYGQELNFYERLGLIDTGTYGKVFRVKKIPNLKTYACKEIQSIQRTGQLAISSFRELNFLFSFKHPNIIFTREAVLGFIKSQIYFIMEYCEFDLKSILDSQIKFSMSQIKIVIKQLLRGLSILHDNGIIHRDLKTSNILLNHKGLIKICDFGLARLYYPSIPFMTQGVVTLWYRAPEVLLGQKTYGSPIDIWSIGCILGELILNEILFSGKTELDQLSRIFSLIGTPTSDIWINLHSSRFAKKIVFPIQPYNNLGKKFEQKLDQDALDLLQRFFTYDPGKRITAKKALSHPFFF